MQLPPALRQAVDRELAGIPLADLQSAAQRLSERYRAETRDGRLHLDDERAARAYLAARLPATFAAVASAFDALAVALPDFRPRTLLDVGAGPGTAAWAAAQCWPDLQNVHLMEASPAIRAVGERLAQALPIASVWQATDVRRMPQVEPRDLVVLAYVLDELAPREGDALVDRLWRSTAGALVVVEPGTPAGWSRILAVRDQLMAAGAHIIAPCPHAAACPLIAPDWCHFAARVDRSRLHRQAKGASVPWEYEKFIYLAVARSPRKDAASRIIAPTQASKAGIALKLCTPDGRAVPQTVAKRDSAAFKAVRRLTWGDTLPVPTECRRVDDG